MPFTKIVYQIVFSPKYRAPVMLKKTRPNLFQYISGVIQNKNCHLYQMNGVEDHLHIVTDVHPSISLSSFIKDIKTSSNAFIKEKRLFPDFIGWQDGYNAFTYSFNSVPALIKYVQNQEEHHKKMSYLDEIEALFLEHGVEFDEKYL